MGDINSSSLLDYEVLGTPRTAFQRYQPGSFMAAAMQNLRRPDGGVSNGKLWIFLFILLNVHL